MISISIFHQDHKVSHILAPPAPLCGRPLEVLLRVSCFTSCRKQAKRVWRTYRTCLPSLPRLWQTWTLRNLWPHSNQKCKLSWQELWFALVFAEVEFDAFHFSSVRPYGFVFEVKKKNKARWWDMVRVPWSCWNRGCKWMQFQKKKSSCRSRYAAISQFDLAVKMSSHTLAETAPSWIVMCARSKLAGANPNVKTKQPKGYKCPSCTG